MIITWPTTQVNDAIKEMRSKIGREITIQVRMDGIPCSICNLDPTTNLSTDPFCPVCHGLYWLNTISGVLVSGHVLWSPSEMPYKTAGGLFPEGACKVTIEYTDDNLHNVEKAARFIVDHKELSLKSYTLRGVPTPNRIRLVLVEEGNDG